MRKNPHIGLLYFVGNAIYNDTEGLKAMFKKGLVFCFISMLLLISPISAFAHTGLKMSSPANGETLDKTVNEISMEFNTDIEPLSTIVIQNQKGESITVTDIKIEQSKMNGKVDSLPNGDYTVGWKIVGRDGHPIESKFTFTVKQTQQETKPSPDLQASVNSSSSVSNETTPVDPASQNGSIESASSEVNKKSGKDGGNLTPILIVVLICVVVIIVFLRVFKGKKR